MNYNELVLCKARQVANSIKFILIFRLRFLLLSSVETLVIIPVNFMWEYIQLFICITLT